MTTSKFTYILTDNNLAAQITPTVCPRRCTISIADTLGSYDLKAFPGDSAFGDPLLPLAEEALEPGFELVIVLRSGTNGCATIEPRRRSRVEAPSLSSPSDAPLFTDRGLLDTWDDPGAARRRRISA